MENTAKSEKHQQRALDGIYDRVLELLQEHHGKRENPFALDLGAWSGKFAQQLQASGYQTVAADVTRNAFREDIPFIEADMNEPHFARLFTQKFDIVTAIEVIEHLENPIAFLRNIAMLLQDTGVAVITTPNMDNVPARLKYLLHGTLRTMDAAAPEHITPIFFDLLQRQYLPDSGLTLMHAESFPERAFPLTPRKWLWPLFRITATVMRGQFLYGDSLIVVLKKFDGKHQSSVRSPTISS